MTQTERREAERREVTTQISMVIADSQQLEGEAVNLSARGVLLTGQRRHQRLPHHQWQAV